MDHNTVLITRSLRPDEMERLRGKLLEIWPHERFTIIAGEVLTPEDVRRAWVGPLEYKETATPVPRFSEA